MSRFTRAWVVVVALSVGCSSEADPDDPAAPGVDAGASAQVRPGKRSDTAGVADPASRSIVVFGGDNGPIVNQRPSPAYLADTWVFAMDAGWTEIDSAGPTARGRHAVALDTTGGRMLAFGGRFREAGTTGNYTLYNDLWAFDLASQTWAQLADGEGTAPAPRYFAATAHDAASGTYYVFGGGTNTNPLSLAAATDLWAFSSGTWSEIATSGTAPSTRLFYAHVHDPTRNHLVVFGGQVGDFVTPAFNDTYALDLATGAWSRLHDGTGAAPSGRFSAMMTYDSAADRYLLVGGHADPGVTNDVWAFDPSAATWTPLANGDTFTGAALGCLGNAREIPAGYVQQDLATPERRSGGVFQMLAGDAWLFGGESDCSDHMDDLWRLNVASGVWTELIDARSGESCARRNDDCTCLCL